MPTTALTARAAFQASAAAVRYAAAVPRALCAGQLPARRALL